MNSEQKPGDPADKITDAKADGAFGGVSHRAGYGDDKLMRLIDFLRQHPRATLASGEGALLLAEIDRMRAAAKDSMDHYADARAEIDRLNAQWERLTGDEAVMAARVARNEYPRRYAFPTLAMHRALTAARDAARREG